MSRSAGGTTSAERGIIFPLQLHVEPHQNEAYADTRVRQALLEKGP